MSRLDNPYLTKYDLSQELLKLRTPPSNVEAEAAFIGACMIDNRNVLAWVGKLAEDQFYDPLHGRIWTAIKKFVAKDVVANPVTLKPIFEHDAAMVELGGPAYLARLTGSGASLIGVNAFAQQIIDLAGLRGVHATLWQQLEEMHHLDSDTTINAIVGKVQATLWSLTGEEDHKPRTASVAVRSVIDRQKRIDDSGSLPGIECRSLPDINKIFGALEPGTVTLVGARPGVGKSILANTLGYGFAANGHPVMDAHWEMTADQRALRQVSDMSLAMGRGLKHDDIRKGKLDAADLAFLERVEAKVASLPLRSHDMEGVDIAALEARVAREVAYWKQRGRELGVLIADYVQLVPALDERGRQIQDVKQQVTMVSRGFVQICKRFGLVGIGIAQLGRKVDDRADHRPQLSDLSESGALEKDADNVLLLWRPEMHLEDAEPVRGADNTKEGRAWDEWNIEYQIWRGKLEMIGAKSRHGRRRTRRVRFVGEHMAVRPGNFYDGDRTPGLFDDEDDDPAGDGFWQRE